MTTSDLWYQAAAASERLTQGDLIFDCPLLGWGGEPIQTPNAPETDTLKQAVEYFRADVVVMTQACDLEHAKVRNVVLCPHVSLSAFRRVWERAMQQVGQNPTAKAWRNTCNDIADGYVWNQAFLNRCALGDGTLQTELRVVDFHEIYTVPRTFLETLLARRNMPRLQLLPPYREHLSQAFARFFMRVGLPQPLAREW
jgi:hypothetical protein